MKKALLIITALALLALAAYYLWQGRDLATSPIAIVERRAIGDTFIERGWLEASQVTPIALDASGEIREMAEEGSIVTNGQLLVAIDTTGLKDNLDRREEDVSMNKNRLEVARYRRARTEREARQNIIVTANRLHLAEMEYEEIRAGLRAEDRRLLEITTELRAIEREDAEESFLRQSNLVSRALASPITLEDFERRLAAATAAHEEAKIEFAVRTAPPREDEVLEWKLAVERLKGELERGERALERRLARADAELDEHTARVAESELQHELTLEEFEGCEKFAPTSGIFRPRYFWERAQRLWQPIRPGVHRWRLDRVADIVQPGAMRVMTMVHEADIARVATNLPAIVRIPALGNLEFTGRLQVLGGVGRDRAEVGPSGVEGNVSGVTVFNAMVSLDQTDERLRPGMSAAVFIESLPVAERLVLPRSAVGGFRADDSTGRVRLENGEVREITGRHIGENLFWIQGGLNEGDRVKRNFEMFNDQQGISNRDLQWKTKN